jgi:hypothetical protein
MKIPIRKPLNLPKALPVVDRAHLTKRSLTLTGDCR